MERTWRVLKEQTEWPAVSQAAKVRKALGFGPIHEEEQEEVTLDDTYNAAKFDKGKAMVSLVDPKFIMGIADVMTMGAEKYAPNSWQTVPDAERRYKDALLRHLLAEEELDPESGLSHLLHAACNVMFLYHFQQENKDAEV